MNWMYWVGLVVVWLCGYYFGHYISRSTILAGLREGHFKIVPQDAGPT